MRRGAIFGLCSILVVAGVSAEDLPWRLRRVPGLRPNAIATARVDVSEWPEEPRSPAVIDLSRFANALRRLCARQPSDRDLRYSGWIADNARAFDADPFLLGALAYRRSMGTCRPDGTSELRELGLTRIHFPLYRENAIDGTLRYSVLERERWVERSVRIDRHPFAERRLMRPEENLYFAAAFLGAWKEQEPTLDRLVDQAPHRHFVSHFVWGDRVMSHREEDQILIVRRRLLEFYGTVQPLAPLERLGVVFGSPLDGAPRVVSSGLGASRDGGDRRHRGVDVDSLPSEPVRAIADGEVVFAGVDLPGRMLHEDLRLFEHRRYDDDALGRGGRYVCIEHPRAGATPLKSCYMHLERVFLETGDRVRRGETLGTVGRSGMVSSAAHLHLELHDGSELLDASVVMRPLLLGGPRSP
jgi:murein DD-endopeptidase MepM/ murein hydrolase activator NlpD